MNFEKFKAMTWKQKLDHIWEYYRWQILVTVGLVIFLGGWIGSALRYQEPVLDLLMINAYEKTPDGEAFRPFLEENGIEYREDAVVLDKAIRFDAFDSMPDLSSAQMLMCTIAAGEPDLIFWGSRDMLPPLQNGSLMDLSALLPPEVLEEQKDNLVYCELSDTGERYPCGIFLEKNPWINEKMYYVDCTVCVAATADDKDLAGKLILWLLEKQ